MDGQELLKGWPGWAKANAARVLASPAWRLETRYGGSPAVLTRVLGDAASDRPPEGGASGGGGGTPIPRINLSVSFEDVPRTVSFAPSPLFPDLWKLRERLDGLPTEILLALVEKECGALFQFLEDVSRRSFSIAGIAGKPAEGQAFRLAAEGGEIDFAVELAPETEQLLGQLSNIDVTHESVRSLTREVAASYAALEMSDGEVAALAAGDCLVPPADAVATWEFEFPDDALVRIVSSETRAATFAEIADGTLGPVPPGDAVRICRHGREIATGAFAKLGEATVVKILDAAD